MVITCISGHFMLSNIGLKKLHIKMQIDIKFFDHSNVSLHKKSNLKPILDSRLINRFESET